VAVVKFCAKLIVFGGVVAFLFVLMFHFRLAVYPYLASALTGSLAIYLWTRPSTWSLAATILAGAAFAAVYGISQNARVFGTLPAFLGLGSLVTLAGAVLWSRESERSARLDTCLTASMFPSFLVVAGYSLALTSITYSKTYDLYLYAFDEQLGCAPGFLLGRLLRRLGPVQQICYFGYEALPLAMAVAFAICGCRRRPCTATARWRGAFCWPVRLWRCGWSGGCIAPWRRLSKENRQAARRPKA
jgi:hypothetical protein